MNVHEAANIQTDFPTIKLCDINRYGAVCINGVFYARVPYGAFMGQGPAAWIINQEKSSEIRCINEKWVVS